VGQVASLNSRAHLIALPAKATQAYRGIVIGVLTKSERYRHLAAARKNRIAGSMLWFRSKAYIIILTCEGEPIKDG